MKKETARVPRKFEVARRWQWLAAAASIGFCLTCFIGWPFGVFWPSIIGFAAFVPSALLFSIRCYQCGWPAFTSYGAEKRLEAAKSTFWGKDFGGIHLPLPEACTKCGAEFSEQLDTR